MGNGSVLYSCPAQVGARDRKRCCGFSALAVRSGSVRMPGWGARRRGERKESSTSRLACLVTTSVGAQCACDEKAGAVRPCSGGCSDKIKLEMTAVFTRAHGP